MQASSGEMLSPDQKLCLENEIGQEFYSQLKITQNSEDDRVEREEIAIDDDISDEEEEDEEEDEEEFSFMCEGANTSPIAAEDAFVDGQIKPAFPLFNRELIISGDGSSSLIENLPMRPPVKKVFVETIEDVGQMLSSTPENDEVAGPYCEWSKKALEASTEVCKKSNSTGFSKIWRFRDLMGRSSSDGKDAFVFLNNAVPPTTAEQPAVVKAEEKSEKEPAVTVKGKVKKSAKGKTASLSAHEVYLKSKAKDEERRRSTSYLPYRPELMGFFTNVSGGLTKNVHPY